MVDAADKLAFYQAILDSPVLCTEILAAHGWDFELAISSSTSTNSEPQDTFTPGPTTARTDSNIVTRGALERWEAAATGIARKLIKLPVSVISGWAPDQTGMAIPQRRWFVNPHLHLRQWILWPHLKPNIGATRPNFACEGFVDAIDRSRSAFKLLFVYLHSPDHPDTPLFCNTTSCSETLAAFVNENFVSWGGSIRATEGFKTTKCLKASRFPFCAVAVATNQSSITLLQRLLLAEERHNYMRLREDYAAFRIVMDCLQREAAEAERKQKEEEEAREGAALEATKKQAALAKIRKEKFLSLGAEPVKVPNVTQVLVRFPNGARKERRFHSTATIQSLYDYVDSLDCLETESSSLVSNFPRVVFGQEKVSLSLKEAGLHPQNFVRLYKGISYQSRNSN
ncbi:plant UBX domain-containing protein 10-like [Quillaja saponaria]|uniref:Plant UBX domain-containing protein 10-like n=1 Tax=Quillaja saponaria TaxID=32244 RepID=A0AAD7L3C6_QUISA|nr:plant UBX domain-containing protein 10-like [Quillaja saponaria]